MASPFSTPTRLGQSNAAGDAYALFLKKFAGEVLTTFEVENIMQALHRIRTIDNGKSASFAVMGQTNSFYHTPGTEIDPGAIKMNEVIVNIDNLLVSAVFIPKIDEAMNHFDVRSYYTKELGRALARTFDANILRMCIRAARQAANITGGVGGTKLTDANMATTASNLRTNIVKAAQTFDEKGVPKEDRYCILKPAQYYLLLNEGLQSTVMNRDIGGAGSLTTGQLPEICGIKVMASARIPSTLETADPTNQRNTYADDYTKTVGVCFQKEAVGTVKLLDLAVESDYSVRHQGTLMVAKYALGTGILRPECSVELATP